MNLAVVFLVVSAGIVLSLYRFWSGRRRRAERAGWERFRRGHAELDRELDRIWNHR